MGANCQVDIVFNEQGGSNPVRATITIAAEGVFRIPTLSFADDAADLEVAFNVDFSQLKGLIILSTQDGTLETNDGTTPDDVLTLAANVPLLWYEGCGYTNPITADITTNSFFTNTGGAVGTLDIWWFVDATP